jgi:hypothetical protein
MERNPRPFLREVATDAIDDRVFARYLRIEYGFVDTAARALGYAVAKAPSFQERRRLGLGPYGGHDKIGATAYANLDKKGT